MSTSSLNVTVGGLVRLLRQRPRLTGALLVLGIAASLSEGVGISLFLPLLHALWGDATGTMGQGWFFDRLTAPLAGVSPERLPTLLAGLIFGTVVLTAGLRYAYDALLNVLTARIGHALRSRLFDQLLRVGYGYLERVEFGHVLNTLGSETWRTVSAVTALVGLFIAVCTAAVYAALLLLISWPLTLVAVGALACASVGARLLTRRVQMLGDEATASNAALAKRMTEGIGGMQTVRLFGRERYEKGRFDAASERVSRVFFRLGLTSGLVGPVYEVFAAALLVGVLVVGVREPSDLPPLLVFIFVLYRLKPRIQSIDNYRLQLVSLGGAVLDVHALLDPSDKPYTRSGSAGHEGIEAGVQFEGVTFRYASDARPALDNMTITIPAGRTTAIVGPSGAGKSTVVKLLFRLYDPSEGTVTVDGRPLPTLDLAAWRGRAAMVSQDVYLFDGTIHENIAYGREGATAAEVEAAARAAHADVFIERLPNGYDTEVGDRGVRLSGGQRQRIALARAVVRNPDLLLLDEATNSLDTLSEHVVQEALESFSRGRTTVVIAHRLSTIEQADHILVLDGGRVVEEGTLTELVEGGGLFAEMYRLQYRTSLT